MADSGQSLSKIRLWPAYVSSDETGIVVLTASKTTILTMDVKHLRRVVVEVINQDANAHAFNAFDVAVRATPGGDYLTVATVAADYTSPKGIIVGASGDLTTLAALATGWVIIDTMGVESLRIQAKQATANGTGCDVHAGGAST